MNPSFNEFKPEKQAYEQMTKADLIKLLKNRDIEANQLRES